MSPLPRIAGLFGQLRVPIGFGLLRLSTEGRPSADEAISLIHSALDRGIRLLDTAESYCLDNKDFHYGERLARLAIDSIPFVRRTADDHKQKGLLLDVDGTLRTTQSGEIYPRSAEDVVLLPNRRETLQRWVDDGFMLFFLSNQSGIASGKLSQADVEAAFQRTVELLGLPVTEVTYCPHPAFPVGCFCRKPLPGLGVYLKRKYKLDFDQSVMVGDMDSDAAFARGIAKRYVDANEFFS